MSNTPSTNRHFEISAKVEYSEKGWGPAGERTVRPYRVTVRSTWLAPNGMGGFHRLERKRVRFAWTEKGAVRLAKRLGAQAREIERKAVQVIEV